MPVLTRGNRIGAACLAPGGLLYLLAERISALAWHHPPYRYQFNYISDLGIPQCGSLICSPLHNVMNTGFAVEGVLFLLVAYCLRPQLSGGRGGRRCWQAVHGIGGVMIALFHSGGEAGGITLHQAGAVMAIGGGNLCLIVTGLRFAPLRTRLCRCLACCWEWSACSVWCSSRMWRCRSASLSVRRSIPSPSGRW